MLCAHISYSSLASWISGCQWKWKLDNLEGHRSEVFSIHFDFGSAIHAALEKHLARVDPLPVDAAVAAFHERFDRLLVSHRERYSKPISDSDVAGLHASGERIVRAIRDLPELRDSEVVHNEFALLEPIARTGPIGKFKGFIDIVLRGKDKRKKSVLWVCDFKSCSWGWDREAREDKLKQAQLFLYKHFLCKKFDIDPKQVRTAFILCKKRPPKGSDPIEFFPVSAGPVSVQRALDTLEGVLVQIEEAERGGVFRKNRDYCRDKFGGVCPYLGSDLCPDDSTDELVQISLVAASPKP